MEPSSVHYYPILAGNSVIGLLQAYNDEYGNQGFYYSETYCDTLNTFLTENAPIAFVANEQALFITDGNKTEKLENSDNSIALSSEYGGMALSFPLNDLYRLDIASYQQSRTANSYMISGAVKYPQHEIWACWAACVASYGYFYTDKNYTYTSEIIADKVSWHDYATMAKAKSALKSLYGISHPYYSASTLRTDKLIQYISNDKPLMAGFLKVGDNNDPGHMVIIRGYASNANSFGISIMDPSIADYAFVSVSTDMPITIPLYGQTYKLKEYLVDG